MASLLKEDAVVAVASANSNFSARLFAALQEKHPNNLIYSPSSISMLMAMMKQGARGETADGIQATMTFPNRNDALLKGYNLWLQSYKGSSEDVLAVANKMFGSTNFRMNPEFLLTVKDMFLTEVVQLDFNKALDSATTINTWIAETTHGKISNFVHPGLFDNRTKLVLVNAIYFKGDWRSAFDEGATKMAPFFLNSKDQVNVDIMYKKSHYPYVDLPEVGAHAVALSYAGDQLSMIIIAPKARCGLRKLEKGLGDLLSRKWFLSRLNPLEESSTKTIVKLKLPKFTARSCLDLKSTLRKMGCRLIGSDMEDLSGIAADGTRVFVSEFLQEAIIEVDEKGVEGAGDDATSVVKRPRGQYVPPVVINFNADRPFLFQIVDFRSNMVLFMGKVTNPSL